MHNFLQLFALVYMLYHMCVGVGWGKVRELIVENVMWEKEEGQKMLAGVPCFPQSVTPNTCAQTQHVWDRRLDKEVTMLVGSCLFIHTCRVLQALLPAVWGPAFFSISMVYEGSTSDRGTKPLPGNLEMSIPWPRICCQTVGVGRYGLFEYIQQHLGKFYFSERLSLNCLYTWFLGVFNLHSC